MARQYHTFVPSSGSSNTSHEHSKVNPEKHHSVTSLLLFLYSLLLIFDDKLVFVQLWTGQQKGSFHEATIQSMDWQIFASHIKCTVIEQTCFREKKKNNKKINKQNQKTSGKESNSEYLPFKGIIDKGEVTIIGLRQCFSYRVLRQ